jgi:protein Mpv17
MITYLKRLNHVLFHKYLWVTNTVSSGVLLAFGDMIQQRIEISYENEDSFDWKRSGNFFLIYSC